MKLRLKPTINNHHRTRKQALKKVRKSIQESLLTKARKKLYKVKHVSNDNLFNNPNDPKRNIGGHYTLTVGINPETEDVTVAIITSLEDQDGNPTKTHKVHNKFVYPIPEDKIKGNSRKSGIALELYQKNLVENRNLKLDDLVEPYREIEISDDVQTDIANHIFKNSIHKRVSKRNRRVVENMIIIK